MDYSAERSRAFLESQGFVCEPEPAWVTAGLRPDFFCSEREEMWVEVKTIGETPLDEKRTYLWKELKARESGVEAKGDAYVSASEDTTEKDINIGLKLAEILLREYGTLDWRNAYAFIPFTPIYDRNIRLTYEGEDGQVLVFGCESLSGRYELSFAEEPRSFDTPVFVLNERGERIDEVPFWEIDEAGSALIAIHAVPSSSAFEVKTLMVGGTHRVRNIYRLRDCTKKAARQLKNGMKYREKPGLVLVYQDDLLVPPDNLIPSAFYGDLTYSFPRGRVEAGDYYYGRNGVFGAEKNRSVSAVSLIRNGTAPFTVHNYWAHHRLNVGLLGGREVTCTNDGRFEVH